MAGIKDAFLGDRPYPHSPGFKAPGTSQDAARATRGRAEDLRARVLNAISKSGTGGLTADQAAAEVGATVLAVRPRVSELLEAKKIEKTGERRRNASGMKAAVWRAKAQ